jgi:hypothetical protein
MQDVVGRSVADVPTLAAIGDDVVRVARQPVAGLERLQVDHQTAGAAQRCEPGVCRGGVTNGYADGPSAAMAALLGPARSAWACPLLRVDGRSRMSTVCLPLPTSTATTAPSFLPEPRSVTISRPSGARRSVRAALYSPSGPALEQPPIAPASSSTARANAARSDTTPRPAGCAIKGRRGSGRPSSPRPPWQRIGDASPQGRPGGGRPEVRPAATAPTARPYPGTHPGQP